MAKYEKCFRGNFEDVLSFCEKTIMEGSITASYEDGSDFEIANTKVAIRVYERYSMIGENRVSMNLTIVGNEDLVAVSAITSGGSQAMLFKINTWGEESFLETLALSLDEYVERGLT